MSDEHRIWGTITWLINPQTGTLAENLGEFTNMQVSPIKARHLFSNLGDLHFKYRRKNYDERLSDTGEQSWKMTP